VEFLGQPLHTAKVVCIIQVGCARTVVEDGRIKAGAGTGVFRGNSHPLAGWKPHQIERLRRMHLVILLDSGKVTERLQLIGPPPNEKL
jgi:hypothetical protein